MRKKVVEPPLFSAGHHATNRQMVPSDMVGNFFKSIAVIEMGLLYRQNSLCFI